MFHDCTSLSLQDRRPKNSDSANSSESTFRIFVIIFLIFIALVRKANFHKAKKMKFSELKDELGMHMNSYPLEPLTLTPPWELSFSDKTICRSQQYLLKFQLLRRHYHSLDGDKEHSPVILSRKMCSKSYLKPHYYKAASINSVGFGTRLGPHMAIR